MKTIRFSLSTAQRQLVLEYGYPFDEFEAKLRAAAGNPKSVKFVLSPPYFEHLLGEIARSANHTESSALNDELNELYEELENEARKHGLPTY